MDATINVRNVKCEGCAETIMAELGELDGVSDVRVTVATGEVSFSATDKDVLGKVGERLKGIGYPRVSELDD